MRRVNVVKGTDRRHLRGVVHSLLGETTGPQKARQWRMQWG